MIETNFVLFPFDHIIYQILYVSIRGIKYKKTKEIYRRNYYIINEICNIMFM